MKARKRATKKDAAALRQSRRRRAASPKRRRRTPRTTALAVILPPPPPPPPKRTPFDKAAERTLKLGLKTAIGALMGGALLGDWSKSLAEKYAPSDAEEWESAGISFGMALGALLGAWSGHRDDHARKRAEETVAP